jgi:hypothetical protein
MEDPNPFAPPRAVLEDRVPAREVRGGAEAALICLAAPVCISPVVWVAGWLRQVAGFGIEPEPPVLIVQVIALMFYQIILGAVAYRFLSRHMGAHPGAFAICGAFPLSVMCLLAGNFSLAAACVPVGASLGIVTWLLLRWHGKRERLGVRA